MFPDGLWGIQPLNEPITDALTGDIPWEQVWIRNIYPPKSAEEETGSAPIKIEFLRKFYEDAYARVMPHMGEDKFFMIHDAFRTAMWKDFMAEEDRLKELKAKCEKKGLNFEEEEAKYQAKLAEKKAKAEAKAAKRK